MSISIFIRKDLYECLHNRLKLIPPYRKTISDLKGGVIKTEVFNFKIDKFYWLLDKLSDPMGSGLKTTEINGFTFTTLCSQYLKDWIGTDYRVYMRYLINQGFILPKDNYDTNKCKQYHLWNNFSNDSIHESNKIHYCVQSINTKEPTNPHTLEIHEDSENRNTNEVVEVKLDSKSKIAKKIIKEYELELGRNRKYPTHLKTMSQFLRKNLKINITDALSYCNTFIQNENEALRNRLKNGEVSIKEYESLKSKIPNKHWQRHMSVINLYLGKRNKALKFNRNQTNKRVDTNLTGMAKDIRPFIIGFENMTYLDLANSQPVLFNILLKKYYKKGSVQLKEEIKRYYLLTVSGNWYEELCDIFKLDPINDREAAKTNWMKIAYSQNKSYKTLKTQFCKRYPQIYKLIESCKIEEHSHFAIKLQKIESEIFINEICKELVENNIIPYSIHDGVLVPKYYKRQTYDIMINQLKKHLGSVPVISINEMKKQYPISKEDLEYQFEIHFNS